VLKQMVDIITIVAIFCKELKFEKVLCVCLCVCVCVCAQG